MTQVLVTAGLIIIGVLLFELIILFHEGGHFLTAKKSGIKVNEFALGMGPKIFSFTKGETTYSLRAFPIGGFCAMEGEDEDSDNPRSFNNAKVWKRMIVVIAGAVMNIVLGLLLMFVIVIQQPSFTSTTVDSFSQNSFSANSGLQKGDQVVKINNYDIFTSRDLSYAMATSPLKEVSGDSVAIYKEDCANTLCNLYVSLTNDENMPQETKDAMYDSLTEGCLEINASQSRESAKSIMDSYYKSLNDSASVSDYTIPDIEIKDTRQRYTADVTVLRNGETVNLQGVEFFTYLKDGEEKPSIAVDFYVAPIEKNFFTVIGETFNETISIFRMVWSSLVGLCTGQFGFSDMSGPIGAASAVTQVAQQGLQTSFMSAVNNIILIMMVISVNLGIVNMLPFPALDGGRFVFLLIEGIFKKPIPRKVESIVNAAGLITLLTFMVVISVKDVWQIFGG